MEPGRPGRCHGSRPTAEAALDDEELVTRVRAGDREAYEALVARHTASAYRTAVLLGAGPDAEDVVQEAFVKAYRKLSRYRSEASFRSWLLAIVANETRNLHRTRNRRDGLTLRAAAADPVATVTADDGLGAVLAAERRAALVGALRRLPERDREVIVCRYLLDLGEDETVTVLGLPRGTVKSRTHRALAKLRALLDREGAQRG
ncbi:RNA polymerase sigma factor [Micromonospora tulbaghiae]|uniref:RNA polymerase sigma factor n=1 Tax=Micromonospora tulbaghiae TaxID=479978 RepID=A0AAW4JG49_9ACTN|nr:RNA polymerase sigma factor [Micromonospora tulbaghiae]MBO4138733.1 RNA polymerase sigma factor [Micromonospora tulbaghiae]MDX5458223.1 RNA polymerase sigma factor [Micromonospora tulbaghiae]SCE75739.1 RNA polymerase sigma-70 factor, ECF subfamily [Micromonospora tulbaghiae]